MKITDLMKAIDEVEVLLEAITEQGRREQARAILMTLRRQVFQRSRG